MSPRQLGIPLLIILLLALVADVGRSLWLDLQELSIAGNENAQWTIFQVDTEFANLQATLLEQNAVPQADQDDIRLRTDILLSRIDLVSRGNAFAIISSDPKAVDLLRSVHHFADEAVEIIDGDLSAPGLARLIKITADTRPLARDLALRGNTIGAERTEARRAAFSTKLRNTGFVAIMVIGALTIALVVLDRSLWAAREKDAALRSSSARLNATISASLDAIFTGNQRGEILDLNPAAERVLGWRRDEVVGKNIEDVMFPRGAAAAPPQAGSSDPQTGLLTYLGQGRVETTAMRKTGEPFPAEMNVTSVSGTTENLLVIYLRDISDRKQGEIALIEAKERAERTDRAKSQFLTMMSHEMRTPLNGILGVLDLLRTTKLSKAQVRYLDVAAGSGEILLEQVNEALDITRTEADALVIVVNRFNLADDIRQLISVLEPLAKEKGLELVVDIDPGMTMDFVADGNRIRQIVTNLVGNAIKFTTHGKITVALQGTHTQSGTATSITVSDTGDGIAADAIETIFDDFVMLSHSTGRQSRGDGLGLAISRKIARLMGGDITARSDAGSGSVFCLTLSLEKAPQIFPETLKVLAADIPNATPKIGHLAILAVEDNHINRSVLRDMLEGMGHSVEDAKDGKIGWEKASRKRFDLILMDIRMPEMDGIELTQKIKSSSGPNQNTPIHGLTAYGEEEFRERALAAGMDGFSTKPIRLHDLARIVQHSPVEAKSGVADPGEVDEAVITELFETLGYKPIKDALDLFLLEMTDFLEETEALPLLPNTEEIAERIHKLSGAAALLGLRSVADGLEHARKAAEQGDRLSYQQAFGRLEDLVRDGCDRFSELIHA